MRENARVPEAVHHLVSTPAKRKILLRSAEVPAPQYVEQAVQLAAMSCLQGALHEGEEGKAADAG